MDEIILFLAVLGIKTLIEVFGRWSDNCYHTGDGMKSALTAAVICAAAIPIGRLVIAKGSNSAAVATVVAVFIGTLVGQRNLEQRQRND